MNNKNKISVYGSTGFIGSTYCSLFSDDIIRIDRGDRVPKTNNVLYLISTTHNYNIFDDPHLDINTNLNILIETLESCKERRGLVFNFISSWFVYGKTEDFPAKETTNCNPKGFYSITKRAAEQLLISYCETFNIKYRILRLCNVYGEGDGKVSKKRNALQHLITELAHNRDINLYNGGTDIRDFMHVDDVCRAINLCCNKGPVNEIINIGSAVPSNFKAIMTYAQSQLNSTGKILSIEPPAFHKAVQIDKMYLDNKKLQSLGFKMNHDITSGLNVIIEHIKKEL